jgi:hypothetical protein
VSAFEQKELPDWNSNPARAKTFSGRNVEVRHIHCYTFVELAIRRTTRQNAESDYAVRIAGKR